MRYTIYYVLLHSMKLTNTNCAKDYTKLCCILYCLLCPILYYKLYSVQCNAMYKLLRLCYIQGR